MISLGLFSRVHRTYKEKEKKGKEKKDEKKTDSKEVKEGNKGGEVKDSPRSKKNNKVKSGLSGYIVSKHFIYAEPLSIDKKLLLQRSTCLLLCARVKRVEAKRTKTQQMEKRRKR